MNSVDWIHAMPQQKKLLNNNTNLTIKLLDIWAISADVLEDTVPGGSQTLVF